MTFPEADAAYPFDPAVKDRPDFFRGLEKLRAFADPKMRRNVFEALSMAEPPPRQRPIDPPASRAFIDTSKRAGNDG